MASSGSLAAGTTSYSSTLTAGTADTVTFTDRHGYITVTNSGTIGILSVRTDGQAATESGGVPGEDCYAVLPGETKVFANAQELWYQSSRVIPEGSDQFGVGDTVSSPASLGMAESQESLAGQMTNPGTHISLISASANVYTVAAAG